MADQQQNPFVLPGFGQSGGAAQNPLLASMEMMRQAWSGLAGSGGLASAPLATPMTLDDLDRRIHDLRAVENWLKMNLSMLSSTIQGIEVQRATIATLKSFAESSGMSADGGPSPLEVVLGLKPGASDQRPRAAQGPAEQKTDAGAARDARTPPGEAPKAPDAGASPREATPQAYVDAATAAAQGWWSAMQKQFDALATATAASFPESDAQAAATPTGGAVKPPAKNKSAGSAAKKAAASKTAARKRPASDKSA